MYLNKYYDIQLIEGIGWNFGLIIESPGKFADATEYPLICFKQNGKSIYPPSSNKCDLITSIERNNETKDNFKVFSNPSNGLIYIENKSNKLKEIRINVFNMNGQKVLTELLNLSQDSAKFFTFPVLINGLYFYQLEDNKGKIKSSGKLVIQK